ncbi:unnamed protein product [Sordaria macrospora k-hell]|uniref:WGS project CABT00000000 data, contig 2.3 n=1 Tax=Sordaria macrospora (strain ATCC MYA-333 / DSM 997 / K(L3346) / K-hell) TaxID=771870 RepID=F7VPI2_SORMK|nr:uncharacterized protein SMAC_02416 [Sordaria macrospora k-hell]CCC07410.1 unnamed protein product [Sordaria macrospora k-hell]
MVPPLVSTRRNNIKMTESESGEEPLAGMVTSVILAMVSLVIISSFLMVFAIYADSFLFVFATAILQFGFGVDTSASICESAILLCLACYVTTKLIYMFLVEKAFIIRSGSKKLRIHSKLYLFNTIVVLVLFSAIVIQWVTSRDSIASNNDSQTMSQQRHSNHGEDAYGLRTSRQQANGGILEQKNNSSTNRVSINSSSISPRPTPSTKPIVDDIGDIALDSTDPMELDDTPTTNNNANNPFNGENLRRAATEDSDEIRMMPLSPRKRGISDSVSPLVSSNQVSPTEVRIDVDYGSSLTQANEAEGVKLGNSVVIATGGRSDGRRRGRSSSRRYEDNSDP